jgi:hypothetical protein
VRDSTSQLRELVRKRDFYAGGLMTLLGIGIALKGTTYRAGTLMHMGPGFMPTALGVILALVGVAIAAAAYTTSEKTNAEDERILPEHREWWAWFCILAGPVLFIIFGRYFGMVPGTFACVFIAALGARGVTFQSSSILAIVVAAFGDTLFAHFIQVPMPVFTSLTVELISIFYAIGLLSYFVFRPLAGDMLKSLIIALAIPAIYEAGLFFMPLTSTFILAGLLSYFAFRQASQQALTSPIVEIIPAVFAVANIFYLLSRFVAAMDGTISLVVAIIVAIMFGIGLSFPPAFLRPATAPAGTQNGSLLGLDARILQFAIAYAVAIVAVCFFLSLYVVTDSTLTALALAIIVAAMFGVGVAFAPGSRTAAIERPGGAKLFRQGETVLPILLALVMAILAVEVSVYLELFYSFLQRGGL